MNRFPLILAGILLLLQGVFSNDLLKLDELWVAHKNTYSLTFQKEDDIKRKEIYRKNLEFINQRNSELHSYTLGMNMFGHMNLQEIVEQYTKTFTAHPIETMKYEASIPIEVPDVDWRTKGAVTRVKHQMECGADYAFSAVGSIESHHKINKGTLVPLSEQEVIDCSKTRKYRNNGCSGGKTSMVYEYVLVEGILSEDKYPYVGQEKPCARAGNASAKIRGYYSLRRNNEIDLSNAVALKGPVSNGIAVTLDFAFYKSGILNVTDCDKTPDHGVVTVGVGSNPKHYIIKNSFGPSWGDNGYAKIARYNNNMCGIAAWGYFPAF